jgi:replication factor C large subunit
LNNFKKQKKKALLLVGPAGTGKTSSVYALAEALGYKVVEVNASDKRNAENIRNIVGSASKQATLFAKPKIILIDEVDGLHGNSDRGGVREINKIVKETRFPIIMTANDEYSNRLKSIKKNVSVVKFKNRAYWDVYKLLKLLSEREGKTLSTQSLKKLASLAQGDVRSAFNDLQNVETDNEVEDLYERAKEINIFDVLKTVFKSSNFEHLKNSTDQLHGMEVRDVILWIGENIINEYEKPYEVRSAYDYISKADLFLGRIYKRQYWRFMYYARLLATIGVGLSKDKMYKKWTRFATPVKITKFFKNVKARNELKSLSEEIGQICHCSKKKAMKEYVYHYKLWNS